MLRRVRARGTGGDDEVGRRGRGDVRPGGLERVARTRGGGRASTRLYASPRDDDPGAPEDPETPAPPDTILAWRESAQHRMEEPMAVPTESLTFTEVGEVTVS